MVLEKENAIAGLAKADGRHKSCRRGRRELFERNFAINLEKNSAHGSDSPETAAFEVAFFFSETEILAIKIL